MYLPASVCSLIVQHLSKYELKKARLASKGLKAIVDTGVQHVCVKEYHDIQKVAPNATSVTVVAMNYDRCAISWPFYGLPATVRRTHKPTTRPNDVLKHIDAIHRKDYIKDHPGATFVCMLVQFMTTNTLDYSVSKSWMDAEGCQPACNNGGKRQAEAATPRAAGISKRTKSNNNPRPAAGPSSNTVPAARTASQKPARVSKPRQGGQQEPMDVVALGHVISQGVTQGLGPVLSAWKPAGQATPTGASAEVEMLQVKLDAKESVSAAEKAQHEAELAQKEAEKNAAVAEARLQGEIRMTEMLSSVVLRLPAPPPSNNSTNTGQPPLQHDDMVDQQLRANHVQKAKAQKANAQK